MSQISYDRAMELVQEQSRTIADLMKINWELDNAQKEPDSRMRAALDDDSFLRTLVERLETKMGLERPFTAAHIAKGLVVQILEGNS